MGRIDFSRTNSSIFISFTLETGVGTDYIDRQVNSKVFPGRLNDLAVEKSSLVASFGVYLETRVEGPQQVVFKSPKCCH